MSKRKNKKSIIHEILKLDNRKTNLCTKNKSVIVKSIKDLPPLTDEVSELIEQNKQAVALMASSGQSVTSWYCHNCRTLSNLTQYNTSNFNPFSEAVLIDCPRCEISKAQLVFTFLNCEVDDDLEEFDDDYDGEELEFNEDGKCISGEEWDYPGSPYLSEDDDIY